MDMEIRITFDQDPPAYQAGRTVSGQAHFETFEPLPVKRVELSILWQTMGKGTEDNHVIFFETPLQDETLTMSTVLPFNSLLPVLPLSFEGFLIKIYWLVRVRVFPVRGNSFGAEARFQMIYPQPESEIW